MKPTFSTRGHYCKPAIVAATDVLFEHVSHFV